MKLSLWVHLPFSLVACSSTTDQLMMADFLNHYMEPTICDKLIQCGLSAELKETCIVRIDRKIKGDRNRLSCTNEEAKACRADYEALTCPAEKAPTSCDKCSVGLSL